MVLLIQNSLPGSDYICDTNTGSRTIIKILQDNVNQRLGGFKTSRSGHIMMNLNTTKLLDHNFKCCSKPTDKP
jgi:hypothetical protein